MGERYYLHLTAACEMPGEPWRYAYQTVWVSSLLIEVAWNPWGLILVHAEHLLRSLEEIVGPEFSRKRVLWFTEWPQRLLTPEDFRG